MISITEKSFDKDMNLIHPSLSKGKTLVLFFSPRCPHCTKFKPSYSEASGKLNGVKFALIDTSETPILDIINSNTGKREYLVDGVPTLVSYLNGKYYSTYGPAQDNTGPAFRSVDDVIIYAKGIGKDPIIWQ